MGSNINIGQVEDEFYRYQMPSLIAKVEGRGNGIKTRVVNCAEVAKALKRPPGYVCKFFGCELGALTRIDDAQSEYIIHGAFTVQQLNAVLQKFIQMFVLCSACKLPETELKVSARKGTIRACCAACGHQEMVDLTHKLCKYIFNNPPPKVKKLQRGDAHDDVDDADAEKKMRRETKEKKTKKTKTAENGDEEKSSTTRKTKKKTSKGSDEDDGRKGKSNGGLEESVAKLEVKDKEPDDDDQGDDNDSAEDEHPVAAMINDGQRPKAIAASVREMTENPTEQAFMLVKGFLRDDYFDQMQGVLKGLKTALKTMEHTPSTGLAICRALDEVAEEQEKTLLTIQAVLKMLYDEGIVEEDQIKEWHAKSTSKARDVVADLIVWLDTAEEESDEEE